MNPRPSTPVFIGLIAACALVLSACGNKGQLTLPPRNLPNGTAQKAAPPAPQPDIDHNSSDVQVPQ
jgi:predicted small lipoprotein YifL